MESSRRKDTIDFRKPLIGGVVQIILSFVIAILGIVAIAIHSHLGYTGAGIWCGAMFFVNGVFGVTSWKYKTHKQLKLYMWLSLVAVVFALILLGITGQATSMDEQDERDERDRDDDDDDDDRDDYHRICNSSYWNYCARAEPLDGFILGTGLLELLSALISFAYCCRVVGACAKRRRPSSAGVNPTSVQHTTTDPTQPGQVVFMTSSPGSFPVDQQGRPTHNGLPVVYMQPVYPNGNHVAGVDSVRHQNNTNGNNDKDTYTASEFAEPPPYSPAEGAVGGGVAAPLPPKNAFEDYTKVDLSQF